MRKLSFSLLVAVFLFIELFGGIPLGFYLILIPGIFVVHHILSNKKLQTLNDFQAVANLSDVTDPGSLLVEIDDQLVVLIHAAGHYYALDDVCTHDGGPLSEGPLDAEEGSIACPRHGGQIRYQDRSRPHHAGDQADPLSRSEDRWRANSCPPLRRLKQRIRYEEAPPCPSPKTMSAKP